MHYPLLDVPALGGGLLIAIVAIVHVFIAHFAVGGGIFLAFAHRHALRHNDPVLLRYARDHAWFLVLFAFVAGALTGVGIWLTIGAVSPEATSHLIHLFVWGWAIEWCFFAIEIVAGYAYYYGFGRLEPRRHLACIWIYAAAAWISLVLITGILSFMLTPGVWPELWRSQRFDLAFWRGLTNPGFLPSVLLRTISAMALAGIFAAVVVNMRRSYSREQRQRVIRFGARFLAPLALMLPVGLWYFWTLPPQVRELPAGGAVAMTLFMAFGVVASLLIGGYAYLGLLRAGRYINLETSLLLLAIAFIATGAMEFVREGIRKPYLIYGLLYSNGIPAEDETVQQLRRQGLLAEAAFARPPGLTADALDRLPLLELGQYVFQAQCRICHEIEGFNALRPLVQHKGDLWLMLTTHDLDRTRYFMPPFVGSDRELMALVEFERKVALGDAYQPLSERQLRALLEAVRQLHDRPAAAAIREP